MAPGVREDGFARHAAARRLRLRPGPQLRRQGGGPARHRPAKQLRKIPTDDRFRIRVDLLRQAVAADRRAGLQPAIVVGNAGTVNTGAIDPLDELADLCAARGPLVPRRRGLRRAWPRLARLRPLFAGIERADSVAADPHKWLYVPYEAGAALVREPGRLADAFRRPAEYLVHDADSPVIGPASFNERGPELSRASRPSRSGWA